MKQRVSTATIRVTNGAGDVRFVTPAVAKNIKALAAAGFYVEELPQQKEAPKPESVKTAAPKAEKETEDTEQNKTDQEGEQAEKPASSRKNSNK